MLYSLAARVWRRILEIPKRGLPTIRPNPCSFDREWGVETSKIVWLTNPWSKNFHHGIRYEACDPTACRWAIESAMIDPNDFCFVDIGCGKGRGLLIASSYPFARLIGVDYSYKLCARAQKNLASVHVQRERFAIICQDAATFAFPARNIFAYFYHPFDTHVLDQVMANLRPISQAHGVVVAYEGHGLGALDRYDWLKRAETRKNVGLFRSAPLRVFLSGLSALEQELFSSAWMSDAYAYFGAPAVC
jgi:SAM-dependent methyltransferase